MSILVTGGNGELAKALDNIETDLDFIFIDRVDLDVVDRFNVRSVIGHQYLGKIDAVLHAAAMTHPMETHESFPERSIKTNILGTCIIAEMCAEYGLKMIYTSTDWVYNGFMGSYSEIDPTIPVTNYGWSKLGGECAVNIVPNHLILRLAMSRRPFPHPKAFVDVTKSLLYIDEAAQIIVHAIENDLKGTYNLGGPDKLVYEFALQDNPEVEQNMSTDIVGINIPKDTSMDCRKLSKDLPEYDQIISHS